jgi:hypothetical protein
MKSEEKTISLGGREIRYHIRQNRRARNLLITVCDGDSFVVTKPAYVSFVVAERFMLAQRKWIVATLEKYQKSGTQFFKGTRKNYLDYKKTAEQLVEQRLKHFNQFYGFKYKRISIRNQKTQWGSCSRAGNLNFNYKILFLPSEMADYLVVHELCHLGQMNHSARFWALVAKTIPDYLKVRRALKKYPVKIL